MAVDFGETWSSPNYEVRDVNAVLSAGSTVTGTITLPDGTPVAATVANPAVGQYTVDYLTVQAGRHQIVVSATGGVLGALVRRWPDEFNVEPADPGYIMGLAAAKEHLNIPAADASQDEELRGWLGAITRLVEGKAGEVTRKSFTERHRAGRSLWLRHPPVISVTSIVPWLGTGSTYAAADVRVTEGGRVELLSGLCFSGGPFAVTYVAGRAIAQANVIQASQIILKHCWETQRGASALPLQAADEMSLVPGFGFAVPNRALELLAPDLLPMNLA